MKLAVLVLLAIGYGGILGFLAMTFQSPLPFWLGVLPAVAVGFTWPWRRNNWKKRPHKPTGNRP